MAKKNNIRSIRFSDELAELIDRQVGDTFTEKFENLVTKCVWELPQKEERLKKLDEDIKRKEKKLQIAELRYTKLLNQSHHLESLMRSLEFAVSEAIDDWKKIKV